MSAETKRLDEVEKHYNAVDEIELFDTILFWVLMALSLSLIYLNHPWIEVAFVVQTVVVFGISLASNHFFLPRAERARIKQNLTNALGTSLSDDETVAYYNNAYAPSSLRLAANTFENSLFSKRVASKMLVSKRIISSTFLLIWLVLIISRGTNMDIVSWVTQLLFSGKVVSDWISLEILRSRHERTFDRFREFFRDYEQDRPSNEAMIYDLVTDYETTKAAGGIRLSSNCFHKINTEVSEEWERVKGKVGIPS